jgi:hypothetical protein
MDKLYRRVRVDLFKQIKEELFSLISDEVKNKKDSQTSWIVDTNVILSSCPSLNQFYVEYIKKPIVQIKFYVSPPGLGTKAHIDGVMENKQPFGLNFPIANTENTFINWYEDDYSNFRIRDINLETLPHDFEITLPKVTVPIDNNKLKLIENFELIEPAFIRSDVMHSITNNTDLTRYTVVLRWPRNYKIEEIISEDLLLD